MSGTSMATPTAAGLAALVREYLARGFYPTGLEIPGNAITEPSGALMKALMIAGTTPMTGNGAGTNPGQAQGWGRTLLDNVLYFDGDQSKLFLYDAPVGLATGNDELHLLTVLEGQPLNIVLAWSDVAAAVNASPATVNSLRLEVTAPNGDVWTQKLPAGHTVNNAVPLQNTTTANYDTINTVHRIKFDTPAAGVYQVRVLGVNVPSGPQTYALVATGNVSGETDPDFALSTAPNRVAICAGASANLNVGVIGIGGYDTPVTLGVANLPGTASGSFATNPVTPALPPAFSALTIANTSGIASGSYNVTVEGVSGLPAVTRSAALTLAVDAAAPAAASLTAPADEATGVATSPSFSWAAIPGAAQYRIEIATDAAFADVVEEATVATTAHASAEVLDPDTTYYWRVIGINACGDGLASAVSRFTTANVICRTVNAPIPDNAPTTGASSTITLTDDSIADGLTVSIKATHTYVGDLKFTLSKGATSVPLVDRPGVPASTYGCSGDNVDIVLDDGHSVVVTLCNATPPALSGNVKPHEAIDVAFGGSALAGAWTLTATDNAGGDTGSLVEWCITPKVAAPLEPAIFANGFEAP